MEYSCTSGFQFYGFCKSHYDLLNPDLVEGSVFKMSTIVGFTQLRGFHNFLDIKKYPLSIMYFQIFYITHVVQTPLKRLSHSYIGVFGYR